MKPGLYRVETKDFVAGFVVTSGGIGPCAPILRKNILFWSKLAVRIGDVPKVIDQQDVEDHKAVFDPARWQRSLGVR